MNCSKCSKIYSRPDNRLRHERSCGPMRNVRARNVSRNSESPILRLQQELERLKLRIAWYEAEKLEVDNTIAEDVEELILGLRRVSLCNDLIF